MTIQVTDPYGDFICNPVYNQDNWTCNGTAMNAANKTIFDVLSALNPQSSSTLSTEIPSQFPTKLPSLARTQKPTDSPSLSPTQNPSNSPSKSPLKYPSLFPTKIPTQLQSSNELSELKQQMRLIIIVGSTVITLLIICTCIIAIYLYHPRKNIYQNHIMTMSPAIILPKQISEIKQTKTNSIEFSRDKEGMNSDRNSIHTNTNDNNIGESYHESNKVSNADLYIQSNNNFETTKGDRKRFGDV